MKIPYDYEEELRGMEWDSQGRGHRDYRLVPEGIRKSTVLLTVAGKWWNPAVIEGNKTNPNIP